MSEIKGISILYCAKCSALFESNSPDEYQSCPRCGSESIRTATVDRPTDYEAANLACAHANTAAWKINAQGYLYCSVCRKTEE
jgi:DNA-directed RNA polymerase subunit RPC12/RpoP